jgi:hypothetical protein
MRKILAAAAFLMIGSALAQDIAGDWQGRVKADAAELHIVLHVARANDGTLTATLDSVDQGVRGIPITSISVLDSNLILTDSMQVKYEGKIDPDGMGIDGTLLQGGRSFPFHLRRQAVPLKTQPSPPQAAAHLPGEPISEEVSWMIGETVVAATITRPDDHAVHPGIVFVAGSGPTDRDWNSPLLAGTNGSAKLLANELAKKGFFTIRYDKRFTGPNAGKNLPLMLGKISFTTHQEELSGAVGQLLARAEVNPKQIYVIGNSEGTLHAMKYQLEKSPRFAGLVLAAPPGRNITELARSQIEAQVTSLANAKEIMAGYDKLIADFVAGRPFSPDPALPQGINNLVQSFNNPGSLPFSRELLSTDAALLINQITSPVLVVIGKKDIQVDWQVDGAALEKAARGQSNVTFSYPENANHILKNEIQPRSALTVVSVQNTYNDASRVLDADALKIIEDWLVGHVK